MNTTSKGPRFSLFDELDKGLNHLMNEVLQHESRSTTAPALSVYEFDDRYVVECDLPGVRLEDVTLQIDDGVLEISGVRHTPYSDDVNVTVNERHFEDFSRKLQLGKQLDVGNVDAELGNGVLKVTVPKKAEIVPKPINIRATGSNSSAQD